MTRGRERFSQCWPDKSLGLVRASMTRWSFRGTWRSAPASLSTATWAPDVRGAALRLRAARGRASARGMDLRRAPPLGQVPDLSIDVLGGEETKAAAGMGCFAQQGVRLHGYVRDPSTFLEGCVATINPLRGIRGSSIKLIDPRKLKGRPWPPSTNGFRMLPTHERRSCESSSWRPHKSEAGEFPRRPFQAPSALLDNPWCCRLPRSLSTARS